MNVFPQINKIINTSSNNGPTLLKEYAWDFENNDFLLYDGKFVIVEGIEALKVRNFLTLQIYRGRFSIYKNRIGTKLKDLIGKSKDYVSLNIENMLKEALVDNIYVSDIEDIEVNQENSKLIVSFKIINIYNDYSETIEI